MFNVTRNTNRTELRQTQTWERLTTTAFENTEVKEYFDHPADDHTDVLNNILSALSVTDRKLLVDHVWAGHSITELAVANGITEAAVRQRLARARRTARQLGHLTKEI